MDVLIIACSVRSLGLAVVDDPEKSLDQPWSSVKSTDVSLTYQKLDEVTLLGKYRGMLRFVI